MSKLRRQLLLSDPSYTVQKLVDKGILTYTESSDNKSLKRNYTFSKIYKKPFKKIKDFVNVFFNDNKTDDLFNLFRLTIDYSKGYLTKEQVDELIEIINTTPHYQQLNYSFRLNLGKTDFKDKDIVLNLYNNENYQMCTDMFSGSTINSVTFNLFNGNISVLQNMFRWSGCKTIKFNRTIVTFDISGWCEGNSILTSHPNNIDYSVCRNIGYAWEWCSALTELPSYYTVTDEESRLSTPANIIGGSTGEGICFCDQAFNICKVLQKIGPVLDLFSIEPNSSQKMPYNMFNDTWNIRDIRLKNIGNGDWSFIYEGYRGLPNMDLASIKYCIENLVRQVDYSFIPYGVIDIDTPTYGWSTLVQSSTKSLMYRRTNGDGKFLKIEGDYKAIIPEGLTMKIVWWIGNGENPYNRAYNEFTYIIGDGQEHTFTNTLTDYQWCTIEIQKTDGSDLSYDALHQILLYNNMEFYIGTNTTNYIKLVTHNIYFSDTYKSQIEARDVITPEIIKEANNKGWNIYIGDTLLTPYDIDVVSYGISWETDNNVCTRIGNLEYHKTLPIQSKLRGCISQGDDIQYFLDSNDWTYKEDKTLSRLDGYDGNVTVYTGDDIYYKSFIKGTTREMRISEIQVDETWHKIGKCLLFAYAGVLLREVPSDMGYLSTLSVNSWISVANTSTYCRGGNNNSSYDQYLGVNDFRTGLGKPATSITRANARLYATKDGNTILDYETYKVIFYWLPIIEYNTFNLDQAFNSELTEEGYHQGGLAPAFSCNSSEWRDYFNYHQFTLIGSTNEFGNNSGCKTIIVPAIKDEDGNTLTSSISIYTFRYRGLENIKNHLWNNLDGILLQNDLENVDDSGNALYVNVYVSTDETQFSDSLNDSYKLVGKQLNTRGYIKEITLGDSGDIIPESVGTPNKYDYNYIGDTTNTTLRTALLGGNSFSGNNAGVGCFSSGILVDRAMSDTVFRVFRKLK